MKLARWFARRGRSDDRAFIAVHAARAADGLAVHRLAAQLTTSATVSRRAASSPAGGRSTRRQQWPFRLPFPYRNAAFEPSSLWMRSFKEPFVHTVTPTGPPRLRRYDLYECVRAYALEQAAALGVLDETEVRHTAHFVGEGLAQTEAVPYSRDPATREALVVERHNLLKIAERETPSLDRARAAVVLGEVFVTRGPLAVGAELCERLLGDEISDANVELRLRQSHGQILTSLGRYAGALAAFDDILDQARAVGDRAREADCLSRIGLIRHFRGDSEAGREPTELAVEEARTNRVRVAISKLRTAGLGSVLELRNDGYRINPRVRVQTA